jgi:cell division protein FtsQ
MLMRNRYRRDSAIRRMKRARFRRSCLNVLAGILGVALMSLFFIFCHDIILQSPYFKVTSLEVTGNKRLSIQEILDTARIKPDTNALLVNIPLSRKYLLSHPWIAEAEITRELPGRLILTIREHDPLAILDMGRKFLIDREGKVFKEIADSDSMELPIIKGIDFSDLDQGDLHRSADYDAVLSLLEMGQNPACILSRQRIRLIHVDREEGITLFSAGSIQDFSVKAIKVGYQDYSEKFVRLEKIIAYFKTNKLILGIDWIDLRQINRVVVSPLNSEPPSDGRKEI